MNLNIAICNGKIGTPQNQRYCQIIKNQCRFMNSLRVKTFVESSAIGDKQKLKAQTKAPHTPAMSLSKSLFYACTVCSGPLVPESYCVFCKKTALRKCTKCNNIQSISNHESCRHLLSFGNIIFRKHYHKK